MVTDCFGTRVWSFSDTEAVFLQGSLSLLKIIIPCAICFVLWRLHTANKDIAHQSVSILGLNQSSMEHEDADSHLSKFLLSTWFLYVATIIVTFTLGLLSISAYEFLHYTLYKLLQ